LLRHVCERHRGAMKWGLCAAVAVELVAAASGAGLQTSMLSGDDFFRQAKRSISHDKKVLRR
jgi:hypothetical protein